MSCPDFSCSIWIGSCSVINNGRGFYTLKGTLYVANRSYHKTVAIHYETRNGWNDVNATYKRSLLTRYGNFVEEWEVNSVHINNCYNPIRLTAYVKYFDAYGQEIETNWNNWDNNYGSDYYIV